MLRKWRTRFYGPVRHSSVDTLGLNESEPAVRAFAYAVPEDSKPIVGETGGALVLRRRWTMDQKRQLVWDGLNSGKPLARFARQQGIHPSVIHRWLKELTRPILTAGAVAPPMFAAVRVAEPPLLPAPEAPAPVPVAAPDTCHSMIEIVLAGDRRIRVGSNVDAEALRRVVAVLDSPA